MRLSHDEYALLVEQAPILVWRSDTTGLCDYFNDRWLEFRGRTLEEERGEGWAQGVHPEDLDRCLQIYRSAFTRRETFEMEYRLARHDGVYRWIFDRGVPIYAADGPFLGYIGSCIDVTARVEAEAALRRKRDEELANLRGLLPICSHCKRIRNDEGYWTQIEIYVSEHSQTDFSHGCCPDCLKREFPETWARMEARKR